MRSSSKVASLVRRFEVQNEKSLVEQHSTSPHKTDNPKFTISSPRSVISKSSSYVSSDGSDVESPSLSDKLSSDHYEKNLMEQRTSLRKVDNTKVTITLPKPDISKSPSCISFDNSDVRSSPPSDQVSSDLCPSQEGTSLSKSDETSSEHLTLADNSLCLFHNKNVDIWGSPLDLNEEDSKLIEEEQDFDSFIATFPSPSFNARSECETFCQEELDKLVSNSYMEEPIFWPFENESYNTPDLDKFLSISPRRNLLDMDISVKSGLDPIRVRSQQKINKFEGISGCDRKTVSNHETNHICAATRAPEIPNMPSRLGKSSNVPNDLTYDILYPAKAGNLIKPLRNLILGRLKSFKESSIEKSIGLQEFDGHVGLGADSESPLCGSPWQITSMMKYGAQRIKRGPVKNMM